MNVEQQLSTLRLQGMERQWKTMKETRSIGKLTLEEGLALLLQAESDSRSELRFDRLKKNASFRYQASIEEVYMDPSRGIDKIQLMELATGSYIQKAEPIIIVGATGCGKSFLASALGLRACSLGHKVAYFNMQKLLLKMKMARLDGTIHKFLLKLSKSELIILDDFGLVNLDQQQRIDLMEIIEDRHNKCSTIITSQLPVATWHEIIGDDTLSDAILDSVVHTSHRIELKGYDNIMDM